MDAGSNILEFPALRDARYPIHKAADRLAPYLQVIVEKFHPRKVVLFGSYAYGKPTWDSDFDLLIVRDDILSQKQSNIEIRQALWSVVGPRPAFTLISCTPEEFEQQIDDGNFVYTEIAEKGLTLYAA